MLVCVFILSFRFVPVISGERPLSAKRQNAIAARDFAADDGYSSSGSSGYNSSPDKSRLGANKMYQSSGDGVAQTTHITLMGGSGMVKDNASISKANRIAVPKQKTIEYLPMRFKGDHIVTAKIHKFDQQHYYMQVCLFCFAFSFNIFIDMFRVMTRMKKMKVLTVRHS